MACPLSAILNPSDGPSQPTLTARHNDEISSEPSKKTDDTEAIAFNAPTKTLRSTSNTDLRPSKSAKRQVLPPVVLSPQQGSLYNRRASTSPTRVPLLQTPRRRDPRTYWPDRAPPSHETNSNRFSVFNALLNYPELILEMTKHLDIEDLISLYAISKAFHFLANGRFTALILGQSVGKAAESSRTFIHRCYRNLCIRDPARRMKESKAGQIRFIPSFRWLRMILFRETTVDNILRSLLLEGHRMPRRSTLVLKKLWFTLDISDNARRVGLMRNERFWSSKDLFVVTMFFLKLDMRLTDPLAGNGELGLRKLLLGQRSLSTLAAVLARDEMHSQLDVLRMIVRYNYEPPPGGGAHADQSIMGVPAREVGRLQYEGWGYRDTKFIPIDELVMRESIRRKLNLQSHYVDMMIYGYMNKKTFEDVRAPVPASPDDSPSESDTESSSSSDERGDGREGVRFFEGDTEADTEDGDGDGEGKGKGDESGDGEMDLDVYTLNSRSRDEGLDVSGIRG